MIGKSYIVRTASVLAAVIAGVLLYSYGSSTGQQAVSSTAANDDWPGKAQLNGLSLNGLSLNGLSLNGLSLNGLSDGTRSTGSLEVLARTGEGREWLRVLAACALPEGQTLEVSPKADSLSFTGSLGLAPEWYTGALSESGQRWVSACVLAHVNAIGARVPVSLRGDHPGLKPSADEAKDYRVQEGAFYGNLFTEMPYALSCTGKPEVSSPYLAQRLCATDVEGTKNACGFVSSGPCDEACDVEVQEDQEIYLNCRLGDDASVSEVVTVFLTEIEMKL